MEMTELQLTGEDYDKAFKEVSFLLEILVSAIGVVVDKSSPSLAFSAGRHMGKKLPVYLVAPKFEDVVKTIAGTLEAGFGFESSPNENGADIVIGRCAVRDVCKKRGLQPGGEICRMFHYYIAGIASELYGGRSIKPTEPTVGDQCSFRLFMR